MVRGSGSRGGITRAALRYLLFILEEKKSSRVPSGSCRTLVFKRGQGRQRGSLKERGTRAAPLKPPPRFSKRE